MTAHEATLSGPHGAATALTGARISAALAIGTLAVLMIGVQPILLGELVERHQVTLEGVGLVAMAEIIALGLGVLAGDAWLPLARLRRVTVLAALVAAALDALTVAAHGDAGFIAVRAAAGLAQGVLVWGTTAVIVRSAQPSRTAAVFFVVQTLAQAALGAALAHAVVPAQGWQGGFLLLGALTLLALPLAWQQPAALAPLAAVATGAFRWTVRHGLPLLAVFLLMAALGAFWAYLEPLGKAAGLDTQAAQGLVAQVLVLQVLGGSLAVLAVRRLPPLTTLAVAALVLAALTGAVHAGWAAEPRRFMQVAAAFGFVWLFMLPFQVGLAFRADASGRVAGLVPAAQLLGSAGGPLAASLLVDGENAAAVPAASVALALAALLLLLAQWRGPAAPAR